MEHIITLTRDTHLHPVICGSALTGNNVETLLDGIIKILPPRKGDINAQPNGIVFGITHDNTMGRGAHIRLFNGSIAVRENIDVGGSQYKITGIRKLQGTKLIDSKKINAGEIATVYGLTNAKVSDVIGDSSMLSETMQNSSLQIPLLQADVEVIDKSQLQNLKDALDILSAEDPAIDASWSSITQKFNIKIMGLIQLEILENILLERFNIEVKINPPQVIYKETPSCEGYGYDRYTMPKPCWAVLKFKITPKEQGHGLSYSCEVTNEQISHRYLKQVETTIPRALKQGMHGWEVTDLHITLIDGEDHIEHTHPLDFVVATPLALMV
jgi:ribosomal protection tetracycline resistance protein